MPESKQADTESSTQPTASPSKKDVDGHANILLSSLIYLVGPGWNNYMAWMREAEPFDSNEEIFLFGSIQGFIRSLKRSH